MGRNRNDAYAPESALQAQWISMPTSTNAWCSTSAPYVEARQGESVPFAKPYRAKSSLTQVGRNG
jgi:hypothetical protein